ncbi:hypothetical protein SAMN04488059_13523 [Devosia psychrophila]|uniref:Uncharacterized protein n=1 Tax=Devosia psychrophila TaxID=728005 RepID=A0A1I1QZ31_9HYPH|nr:hypothetical protein SAMN04488059_13523 [Devosia psychrophila]
MSTDIRSGAPSPEWGGIEGGVIGATNARYQHTLVKRATLGAMRAAPSWTVNAPNQYAYWPIIASHSSSE